MKANELRIGNLVGNRNDFTMHVVGIYKNEILLDFDGNQGDFWDIDLKELKPIPLSIKWLEQAGFVEEFEDVYAIGLPTGDGVDLLLEFGDCCLRRNHVGKEKKKGDKNPYDYSYIKAPKYVHQLQNLYFALTGEELIIKP